MSNIRWSVMVPEDTDRALRSYLARTGGKKGDLSRFVDDAGCSRYRYPDRGAYHQGHPTGPDLSGVAQTAL